MGKGKLVFKGEKAKSKKKKKSKHSSIDSADLGQNVAVTKQHSNSASYQTLGSAQSTSTQQQHQPEPSSGPVISKGKGKIASSDKVLMGYDTNFMKCLQAGDAILVNVTSKDGSSSREEMRVVTMILSNTSASVSSSFSNDLKHPTAFQYIAKPKDLQKERQQKEKQQRLTKEEIDRSAFGTYKSGDGEMQELVYRERTEHGSYRIRRELVGSKTNRSNLLDMRTQKKSDKYC
jgi:hypothetical protein